MTMCCTNANRAKDLETATVLYADPDGSTDRVDRYRWEFSAEIYKAYLRCAAQIIRREKGTITACDGDRIMAIFTGGSKNTSAVRCALKINDAVCEIVRPAVSKQYTTTRFKLMSGAKPALKLRRQDETACGDRHDAGSVTHRLRS